MAHSIAPKKLTDLPIEIIQAVAEQLDARSILVLTTTTRRLREACDDVAVWKSPLIGRHSLDQIESRTKIFTICGQDCRRAERYGLAISRMCDLKYELPLDKSITPESLFVDALAKSMLYVPQLKLLGCKSPKPFDAGFRMIGHISVMHESSLDQLPEWPPAYYVDHQGFLCRSGLTACSQICIQRSDDRKLCSNSRGDRGQATRKKQGPSRCFYDARSRVL